MKPQLHYIHADAQIGKTYYLWGFNILCLLFRGDAAILIVCGEISYGKHKKLSHPFLGVGFSATTPVKLISSSWFLLLLLLLIKLSGKMCKPTAPVLLIK